MNESRENPTTEPILPTLQDLQNLEIEVDGLGRGDLIHEMTNRIRFMKKLMVQSETAGWSDYLLNSYNEYLLEIRKIIVRARFLKAEGKPLKY